MIQKIVGYFDAHLFWGSATVQVKMAALTSRLLFLSAFDGYDLTIAGFMRTDGCLSIPSDILNVVHAFYVHRTLRLSFCDQRGDIDARRTMDRGVMEETDLMNVFVTVLSLFAQHGAARTHQTLHTASR